MRQFIVEYGIQQFLPETEMTRLSSDVIEDLEKYLHKNPHPEYCLVSCRYFRLPGKFRLVWERK